MNATARRSVLWSVIALAAALAMGPAVAQRLGTPAPDITFMTQEGQRLSLAELGDGPVVLEWADPDCGTHQKFYGSGQMSTLQRRATAQDITWVTVYVGQPPLDGAPSHLTADAEGALAAAFNIRTAPTVVLLDGDGVVRYRGAIDSIPSDDPRDLARGENYLFSAIRALRRGEAIVTAQTRPYGCPLGQ